MEVCKRTIHKTGQMIVLLKQTTSLTRKGMEQLSTNSCRNFRTSASVWGKGSKSKELDGKVALVTGSTSGIGLGIAEGLAARGCNVILTGRRAGGTKQKLQTHFHNEFSVRADYLRADLTQTVDTEHLISQMSQIYPEGIDILINNAGFQHVSPVSEFPDDKWDAMLAVNLSASFRLIKYLLPKMLEQNWGRIVNISSVHGVIASPNKCAYVTAKHGLIGLTKVIGLEAAGRGVTCNAICPGFVETPILQMQVEDLSKKQGISYEEAKEIFIGQFHATKGYVTIEQISDTVAYLCSDAASQVTGSSIVMDGGWSAK